MRLRMPIEEDASKMWELARNTPDLDLNSLYHYLMLATHFRHTCVVAEIQQEFAGFASGVILPRDPTTLFIWQIAVNSSLRAKGLGTQMLEELLGRSYSTPVKYLSATITPSNHASWHLFRKMAHRHGTSIQTTGKLERHWFGPTNHDEELIVKIGPFRSMP
ncbi:MAG TPA: diaminobutyrate acetyltransferase [Sulfobacillus sp.]|nr:diaminobutyrate acetyltransferase [Sulfobacillus sp.]